MAFSNIKDLVQWVGGFSALLFVVLLVYVLITTQSLHVLRWRIWRLVVGDKEPTDLQTRAYVDEQSSLVAFRLFSGLPVRTLSEIGALRDWADARGFSLHELSGISRFFDLERRCIRLPYPRTYRLGNGLAILLTSILLLLSVMLSAEASINIRLRASDQWYWVNSREAQASRRNGPLWPGNPDQTLSRADCSHAEKAGAGGFAAEDRQVLCELWQSSSAVMEPMVAQQQWGFRSLAAIVLVLLAWRVRRAEQLQKVNRLRPMIMASTPPAHHTSTQP